MYGKVKMSKRQIKEDKFTIFMLNAKRQFMENWQWYVIGAAVIILAVVATVYYTDSRAARQQEATERLSRAIMDYRTGSSEVAQLSLAEVAKEYSGTAAADRATFILAKLNYESRNYPEAIRYYEMYLNDYSGSDLRRAAAMGGVAACYENQGDHAEAARRFVAAIDAYPDGPMESDYRMAAMRNYLLGGEIEPARVQFETIQKKFGGTEIANKASKLFIEKSNT